MGAARSGEQLPYRFGELWHRFTSQCRTLPVGYPEAIAQAQGVRNMIVHGKPVTLGEEDLLELAVRIEEISKFVATYGLSADLLPALRKHYGHWLRPEIKSVRIVQRRRHVFLETVLQREGFTDQEIRRNLRFIRWGTLRPSFQPDRTAEEIAESFIEELGPYDLANCTDLFTPEASKELAARFERNR